ncbi:MAG: tRNA (adenosine(37)-N6)-dimethylallyltransferase MiaA [Candidatus Firestonebacteria bacterium]
MKLIKNSNGHNLLVVIAGPTASGKSETAARLAYLLQGEIVSADSIQIYKHINVGASKPTVSQLNIAKHHLVDELEPTEKLDAFEFAKIARERILTVSKAGKLPILTGGTGLYIKAVVDGIFEAQKTTKQVSEALNAEAAEKGITAMHEKLSGIDPAAAMKINKNDKFRILRALEVFETTGKTISGLREKTEPLSGYDLAFFGLELERKLLYERINNRAEEMIKNGLLEETKKLIKDYGKENVRALRSLGYKHMCEYLDSKYTLERAVELMKRDTRRYAKRQFTWFRADKRYTWLDNSLPENTVESIKESILKSSY